MYIHQLLRTYGKTPSCRDNGKATSRSVRSSRRLRFEPLEQRNLLSLSMRGQRGQNYFTVDKRRPSC